MTPSYLSMLPEFLKNGKKILFFAGNTFPDTPSYIGTRKFSLLDRVIQAQEKDL
jgi:hypothetical protein